MTAPRQRASIADRVQRLEAWAFSVDGDVAEIKAAVEQLPALIRREVLDHAGPVFGEIMAGSATLATKEQVDALERRLTDLVKARFESMDARFESVDAKLDQVLAAVGRTAG